MKKIFIDGSAGTTGLRIHERLSDRKDIEFIVLPERFRKDTSARKDALNQSDISFLCLPDAAAIESSDFVDNSNTVIIDTSTAHRVHSDWDYGFPELSGKREKIIRSKRISNPGCYASGFISLMAPLTENGILPGDAYVSCSALTGYSGGGKKMIQEYEDPRRDHLLDAPRLYALGQTHKHLKEMSKYSHLANFPAFLPIVSSFYSGMEVVVTLFRDQIHASVQQIRDLYRDYYTEGLVRYADDPSENGYASAKAFSGIDDMQISVHGNDERILLMSRFDNLGKGASGAAIQNMNLVLGLQEDTGLNCSWSVK